MTIGDKIKALRKSQGLSLQKLAEKASDNPSIKLDISTSFLSDIEMGKSNPSFDNLQRIAKALETPVSYFVESSENSLFSGAIEDKDFIPVVELLKDFNEWNIEDKQELLYYLKAKKVIRDNR